MSSERTRPRPRRFGGSVALAALIAFVALFATLAYQVRTGHDPALGAASAQPASPRRVIVRRIVKRIDVVHVVRDPEEGGISGSASGSGAPASTNAAGGSSTSVAPAPAPAPAPVTRSS